MFTEPELIVRRAGRSVRYFDSAKQPLGDALFAREQDQTDEYAVRYDVRDANQKLVLTLRRMRQRMSFTNPVAAKLVLGDEQGDTIASIDVLKTSFVRCVVSAEGEQLGELKPRSRWTGRSFVVGDAEGRELASIKQSSLLPGGGYRITRSGSLPPLWQCLTTVLSAVPVLYPPSSAG